jgi:putative phosphoesterase
MGTYRAAPNFDNVAVVIVGILSDSHGKADMTATAVRLLLSQGAKYLIHCGDIGSESVLDALAGHPSMFVFGNNDWDRRGLAEYAKTIGVACGNDEGKLSFNNKLVVVTHGDDSRIVSRVLSAQLVDYLFVGHTHVAMDSRERRVRVINPGALYRAARKTVALLDTQSDVLKFIPVDDIKK